jgi:ketosteroid isomerase-like protein
MSGDDLALVRQAYETWNREGPAAIASMLAADVEVHDAPELPDAQVWKGREAAIGRLQAVADAVGGGYVEFEGFERRGDAVLVTMRWELGTETRAAELGTVFHLVDAAGGEITRIRVFLTAADVPAD